MKTAFEQANNYADLSKQYFRLGHYEYALSALSASGGARVEIKVGGADTNLNPEFGAALATLVEEYANAIRKDLVGKI